MLDPTELLLPLPIHLFLVLMVLSGWAWLSGRRVFPATLRVVLPVLTLWAWVFTTPAIANLLVKELEGASIDHERSAARQPDRTALIVVLASGTMTSREGRPRPRLDASGWERLRAGLDLWHEAGGMLLLTGGPAGDPEQSLAGLMRRIAISSGVPSGAIVISPDSGTTYEDLILARDHMLRHQGNTWLVTSAMHMPRAMAVAQRLGLSVHPRRCDYRQIETPTWRAWLPDNGGPAMWSDVLHEIVGRKYYQLRGWA